MALASSRAAAAPRPSRSVLGSLCELDTGGGLGCCGTAPATSGAVSLAAGGGGLLPCGVSSSQPHHGACAVAAACACGSSAADICSANKLSDGTCGSDASCGELCNATAARACCLPPDSSSSPCLMTLQEEFDFLAAIAEPEPADYGQRLITFPSATNFWTYPKNRYRNILPNEVTRVRLHERSGEEGSDYINANYICDDDDLCTFISCQAPLPNTFVDHWRMVWEQNSAVVVMLSKLVERNKLKAHEYWPIKLNQTVAHGDVLVTLVYTESYDGGIEARFLNLEHAIEGTVRQVLQLHYTNWPDFGVPESPKPILTLARLTNAFRKEQQALNGPIIVHCSAGIGRSGTYIAIHMALQKLELGLPINVMEMVKAMRQRRCGMVQTLEQYAFIYTAVAYAKREEEGALDDEHNDDEDVEAGYDDDDLLGSSDGEESTPTASDDEYTVSGVSGSASRGTFSDGNAPLTSSEDSDDADLAAKARRLSLGNRDAAAVAEQVRRPCAEQEHFRRRLRFSIPALFTSPDAAQWTSFAPFS